MGVQERTRGSGILLAVSSLPSPFGIGTLGDAAFRFVDLLVDLRQKYWQVLPSEPAGARNGRHPFLSAFAGNPCLIDLESLSQEGLLTPEEIGGFARASGSEKDTGEALLGRLSILRKACERFDAESPAFAEFFAQNRYWLEDYTLYMAVRESRKEEAWQRWPEEIRKKQPVALAKCRSALYNNIRFWGFCQYKFYEQWFRLKRYASARGIRLIGNLPLYIGEDSADVWAHDRLFLLDEAGYPLYVTASADRSPGAGQVWGSPLYDWAASAAEDFAWWRQRMRRCAQMFDVIKIDRFDGLVKSYGVPRGQEDASGGRWFKGPGRKLAEALNAEAKDRCVIADDGCFSSAVPGAGKLSDRIGWLRTRVLSHAFDGNTANVHLPHNYTDCREAVYTGYDGGTTAGYFRDKTEYELAYLYEYLHIGSQEDIADAMIRCAYASVADIAVVPMQDLLKIGGGTSALKDGSWRWSPDEEQLDERRRAWIRNLAAVYRR